MANYLLASDEELARLQLQARVWEPQAEALLDRIAPQPGWSVIDIGCGAMGILGPLKRRVGPRGRVVGIDADANLLRAAQVYTRKEGLAKIELRHVEATATGLPGDNFDLVHTRFLFPHIPQPETLLTEMVRLAKPGGVVVAQEPDHSSWNFYPPCSEWPEFLSLLEMALAQRGDINIGRKLYTMFREAGLADISVNAGVVALHNQHPYMRMPVVAARAMKEQMIAAGLVTSEHLEQLSAAVAGCAADPARIMVAFTVIQVWGKKL